MKKILIVTDAWYPQVASGVLTILNNLIPRLKEKGFEVVIIHPGLFPTFPLPFYREVRIPFFTKRKVESIIMQEKPDYIHIMTESVLGFWARYACRKNNLKFTTSYCTDLPLYIEIRIGFFADTSYRYLRWFHDGGEKTIIHTKSLKSKLEQRGFKKNLTIWPAGVDTDLFKPNNGNFSLPYQRPIFVYLGRIAIEKNLEEFLRCSLPGTKLIIGDGPLRHALERKYKDSAIFVGYKKGQELVDILASCDVAVFPSETDTFGLTIIEAMACGLPVAAHDVIGPGDVISHGVDGFLDKNLEFAALQCLKLSREAGRKKALTYSWDVSTQEFIDNLIHS
ncbi:MAG: glycosyltransferase family 1 protein [Patescibacteria group bacterium]|nr:glycosyltransferase family 1 protein [Patescibacteria group bacterium]